VTLLKPVIFGFAAACLIGIATLAPAQAQMGNADQMVTNGPQNTVESQSRNWSAQQNVINSGRYDRMVQTNRAFREARMREECGPITDPQLHANCIATFHQAEPM
jgi:hypothetical protein